MSLARFAPLLVLLMGCPRTPVPALQANAEAQIRTYAQTWGGSAVLEDVQCPTMAGGIRETEYCTSTLEGETVGWAVTITPVDGSRLDSVFVAPAGFVFTRALEASAINRVIRLLVTPPQEITRFSASCGDGPFRRASPGDPVDCTVTDAAADTVRVLRGALTNDLEPDWSDLEDETL